MKKLLFLLPAVLILLYSSCDKVDDPYVILPTGPVDSSIVWDDSTFSTVENNGLRFALIEEYTGFRCTSCPAGADEIVKIKNQNTDHHVISIGIHVTETFAAPRPGYEGNPPQAFSTDFRTPEGEDYSNTFDAKSLPKGMVNRYGIPTNYTKWAQQVNSQVDQPAIANLKIVNYYDDSTNTFQTAVHIEWLEDVGDSLKLQIQLIEDNVLDWQVDGRKVPPYIENYNHHHVFRRSVNGTYGTPLESAATGTEIIEAFSSEVDPLNVGYVLENLEIVAYIYSGSSYHVYQVNEAKLVN